MEGSLKRPKTSGFTSDADAREYMDSLGALDMPLELWVNILSSNPRLSVQDIQHMCAARMHFQTLCESGVIWNEIFRRQFGQDIFREYQKRFEPLRAVFENKLGLKHGMISLILLLGVRIYDPNTHWDGIKWVFRKKYQYFNTTGRDVYETVRIVHLRPTLKYIAMPRMYTNPRNEDAYGRIANLLEMVGTANNHALMTESDIYYMKNHKPNMIEMDDTVATTLSFVTIMLLLQDGWEYVNELEDIYTGNPICTICNINNVFAKCGACNAPLYCSQDCADGDWSKHKLECGKK